MDLYKRVRSYMEKQSMLKPGNTVLASVSGGPDSMALLHLLYRLGQEMNWKVYAAHLNHMFRGQEADADQLLVQETALDLGITCFSERIDVPLYREKMGLSSQVAARQVRYNFFQRVAERVSAHRVALGHHADDQAETLLLNILRGTGPSGLKGMLPIRDGLYIRPLLEVRKEHIVSYCKLNGLAFREDASNAKPVYMRNRIRLELLPLLENNYNVEIVSCLNRLAEIIREEDRYLEEELVKRTRSLMTRVGEAANFKVQDFLTLDRVFQRRFLRSIYTEVTGEINGPGYGHIVSALELISGPAHHGRVQWPCGLELSKGYNVITVKKQVSVLKTSNDEVTLTVPGITLIPGLDLAISASIIPSPPEKYLHLDPFQAVLDLSGLPDPLVVRSRKKGDVFWPLGIKGKIKLKKFFINQKVPREFRDRVPLVAFGDNILWVAGMRPGHPWRVKDETSGCLHLKLVKLPRKNTD